jgi:hypothetical protein
VNYLDITDKEGTQQFSTLVDQSKYYRFQLRAKVESSQWFQLLAKSILLYRQETNFVVKIGKDQVLDKIDMKARKRLYTKTSDFLVHTDQTILAVLQIAKLLGESSGMADLACLRSERFSIYFETTKAMPKEHYELIDRLAGGEAYIRTCADASVSGEGYTVLGSFDLLRRALRPLAETTNNNSDDEEQDDDAPTYCSLQ